MAIPVLNELNEELTRLCVAGSRLSTGDQRLTRYLAIVEKLGERAPAFLKLAQYLRELIDSVPEESAERLLTAESFLLSLLGTQGDTSYTATEITNKADISRYYLPQTEVSYRMLSPVITALTTSGGGRYQIIKDANDGGMMRDPRVYPALVTALNDRFPELVELVFSIICGIGEPIVPFLREGFDISGGHGDGRRLNALHEILGASSLPLIEGAFEHGSAAVKAEAAALLGMYSQYETLLIDHLDDRKEVKIAVMKALIKMGSREGIKKIRAMPQEIQQLIK